MKQKLLSEFTGTALLLMIVVGSGIMGERLSAGNTAIALLANSLATGLGLFVIIHIFQPISGAHFNPAVSLVEMLQKKISIPNFSLFVTAQVLGGGLGVLLAHQMFDTGFLWHLSAHSRSGFSQYLSEAIATFGLLLTIQSFEKFHPKLIPVAVGAYITSAYWFTSSTSFANPAVTISRTLTPTFTGIQFSDVLPFCFAQVIGAILSLFFFQSLVRGETE